MHSSIADYFIAAILLASSHLPVSCTPSDKSPKPPVMLSEKSRIDNKSKDGAEMVYVPTGEFTAGGYNEATPNFKITLEDYWIDKYEVTNALFSKFIKEIGYTPEGC